MTWLYYIRHRLPLNPLEYFRELLIGFAVLGLGAALFMAPAILHHAPPCTPQDRNTINGNPACRVFGAVNTSVKTKGE